MIKERIEIENDEKEPMSLMIEHRVPWLALGLVGGLIATLLASRFEQVLSNNIQLAFFIPIIVYMADAVGHQTESVYIENLTRKKVHFHVYLLKEFVLGNIMGALFGTCIGMLAFFWFKSFDTALTVGYAMFVTMGIAPITALVIPTILWKEHKDPAVGSGPFVTVLQDLFTLLIYFYIASIIIFR